MRIAVMGTGGVGGYFGARLAAAGEEVTFVARGRHLEAIRAHGLRVASANGDLHLAPAQATDQPAGIGTVDLVMVAVKLWDTAAAIERIRPMVGPGTAVVSFQNGIEAPDVLRRAFGAERVMGGVAHIAAVIGEPGVIRHTGTMARLTFGEFDGRRSSRAEAFLHACGRAGFDAVLSDRIEGVIWEKFVFLSSFSGITALTRLPAGPIRRTPATRALFVRAVEEAVAVARARGIGLAPELTAKLSDFFEGLPADMKSSMLQDLERGNRLELPWLSGAVARLGSELDVPTPVHAVVAGALAPYADGSPR